jgi:long-chain acyl-CoA synthetase
MEYYGHWYSTNCSANCPIYPTISEDDYEYILNHSGQSIVLYWCRNLKCEENTIRHKVLTFKRSLFF